jgi:hypothetical protein
LLDDICKVDNYKFEDGKILYNDKVVDKGHGDKSVRILKSIMTLSDEEEACIRWHMGAFDEKENWKHYSQAVAKFPNVLWTHTADMYASQVKGV